MFISQLDIHNYRIIGDKGFSLELKPFTLIVGENNAGKSTILKSIELVLSQDISIYRSRMLELDDINYKSRIDFCEKVINSEVAIKEIKFPEVEISLIFKGLNPIQEAIVGDWFIDKNFTEAKVTYKFKPRAGFNKSEWIKLIREKNYEKASEIEFPIKEYDYVIYGGGNENNKCDSYLLSMLKMDYLEALRDAKKELVSGSSSNLLFKILDGVPDGSYDDIKSTLSSIDTSISSNETLSGMTSTIKDLLDKVSLDYSGDNDVSFNFNSPEIREMLKKLSLRYGTNPIDINRNGLGRNNLLYISLVISKFANTNYFGKETQFRLVGIEEPEAHLHVHLQDHLAKNIKGIIHNENKDTQLIMTSHSTHICGTLDIENTVVIYNDNGIIKNHYILSGFNNSKDDIKRKRYLQKYLDATKTPMFFSRRLILVEGIAEQILIPTLFEKHTGKTLESVGCSLLNVNGIAFKNFLEIIRKGYYIKCAVLTDGDKGTETEDRAINLIQEYSQCGEVISINANEVTFEKEIMEFNKGNHSKKHILEAYKETRPKLGKAYNELFYKNIEDREFNVAGEIVVDDVFAKIEDYKSEFAYNLNMSIEDNPDIQFIIPDYIKAAFDFIIDDK
ncbi:AAA family ATPase [Romboutsia sedimentorum]|uniref:ATP-dependent nuclease n=1 Tax=Romboutsia sedimentorum TaxID=1368474 RepID=UPI0024DEC773|nr:AAA family ATPase [Romboutsia sedimentorum]MDK2586032.1 AAA family ATPase [Romboutsia sedimentorum]